VSGVGPTQQAAAAVQDLGPRLVLCKPEPVDQQHPRARHCFPSQLDSMPHAPASCCVLSIRARDHPALFAFAAAPGDGGARWPWDANRVTLAPAAAAVAAAAHQLLYQRNSARGQWEFDPSLVEENVWNEFHH
jgi:hypothetical protein